MIKTRAGKPHKAKGRTAKRGRQERAINRFQTDLIKAKAKVNHPDPNIKRAAADKVTFCQCIIENTERNMVR